MDVGAQVKMYLFVMSGRGCSIVQLDSLCSIIMALSGRCIALYLHV